MKEQSTSKLNSQLNLKIRKLKSTLTYYKNYKQGTDKEKEQTIQSESKPLNFF